MRVRVFDKSSNSYFISEVYAIINSGINERYLVVQEIGGEKFFKFFDYLNLKVPSPIYPVNINIITKNVLPDKWIIKKEDTLEYFKSRIPSRNQYEDLYSFSGYGFIFEKKELIIDLFYGKSIPYETLMKDNNEISTKLKGWNYIENQEGIEQLMNLYNGFHDSVIVSIDYISGSYSSGKGIHCVDDVRQVSVIFDNDLFSNYYN